MEKETSGPTEIISAAVKATVNTEVTSAKRSADEKTTKITESEEIVAEKFFEEQPVRLWLDYSHTIPMRAYESAKISIGISIPVGKEVPKKYQKKLDDAHAFGVKFIEEKMETELKQLNEFIRKAREETSM